MTDTVSQPNASSGYATSNGQRCVEELRQSGFNEFDEEETRVTFLEASSDQTPLTKQIFGDSSSLSTYVQQSTVPKLRIMSVHQVHSSQLFADCNRSIPQYDSFQELEISKPAMESILLRHDVSPDFLSVLSATGWPPRESEEGFGHAITNRYFDTSFGEEFGIDESLTNADTGQI
jgi:hypothetical protein